MSCGRSSSSRGRSEGTLSLFHVGFAYIASEGFTEDICTVSTSRRELLETQQVLAQDLVSRDPATVRRLLAPKGSRLTVEAPLSPEVCCCDTCLSHPPSPHGPKANPKPNPLPDGPKVMQKGMLSVEARLVDSSLLEDRPASQITVADERTAEELLDTMGRDPSAASPKTPERVAGDQLSPPPPLKSPSPELGEDAAPGNPASPGPTVGSGSPPGTLPGIKVFGQEYPDAADMFIRLMGAPGGTKNYQVPLSLPPHPFPARIPWFL